MGAERQHPAAQHGRVIDALKESEVRDSPRTLLVLWALTRRADRHGWCFPLNRQIQRDALKDPDSPDAKRIATRALSELRREKLLRVLELPKGVQWPDPSQCGEPVSRAWKSSRRLLLVVDAATPEALAWLEAVEVILRDGEQANAQWEAKGMALGRVSLQVLQTMIREGRLAPGAQVRRVGTRRWVRADNIGSGPQWTFAPCTNEVLPPAIGE